MKTLKFVIAISLSLAAVDSALAASKLLYTCYPSPITSWKLHVRQVSEGKFLVLPVGDAPISRFKAIGTHQVEPTFNLSIGSEPRGIDTTIPSSLTIQETEDEGLVGRLFWAPTLSMHRLDCQIRFDTNF